MNLSLQGLDMTGRDVQDKLAELSARMETKKTSPASGCLFTIDIPTRQGGFRNARSICHDLPLRIWVF